MKFKVGDKVRWSLGERSDLVNKLYPDHLIFNKDHPSYMGRIIYLDEIDPPLSYLVEISSTFGFPEFWPHGWAGGLLHDRIKNLGLKEKERYAWFADEGLEPWIKTRCKKCI